MSKKLTVEKITNKRKSNNWHRVFMSYSANCIEESWHNWWLLTKNLLFGYKHHFVFVEKEFTISFYIKKNNKDKISAMDSRDKTEIAQGMVSMTITNN